MIMMMITTQVGMRALLTEAHAMTARDWRVLPSSSSAPSSLLSMSSPSPSLPLPISGWSLCCLSIHHQVAPIPWNESLASPKSKLLFLKLCFSQQSNVSNARKVEGGILSRRRNLPSNTGSGEKTFLETDKGCPTGASCPRGCGPSQEGWTPGL